MRTVWAQATRPKLSSAAAPRPCVKSIAARRTAAANAFRNQVAACDVFALLLGPVLAVAAFADVSWKERKRKEWDKRFAEINQQLEVLRAREVEVWTRIQYHSVRNGMLQHRRMYSTGTAAATVSRDQPVFRQRVEPEPLESMVDDEELEHPSGLRSPPPLEQSTNIVDDSLGELPFESPLLRYEKLLALRLALRMLLHVYSGSVRANREQAKHLDLRMSTEAIGRIVLQLRAVTHELDQEDRRYQKKREKVPFRHELPEDLDAENFSRAEIEELGKLYNTQQIDVAGLVDRLSQWLLVPDRKPPAPDFYARLVMMLSMSNLPELAKFAVSALRNTTYFISNREICLMLAHCSVARDYKAYDWIMWNLTDKLGVLHSESIQWEWARLSGLMLPIPKDRNVIVIRALIRTALNFDFSQRAEAYAQVDSILYSSSMMGYVIKAFLQHYAKTGDWTNGQRWLQKAHFWLNVRRHSQYPGLRAFLLRIFDFLVAFRKKEEFGALLDAVTAAGIDPPNIDRRSREGTARIFPIVSQWRTKINATNSATRSLEKDLDTVKSTMWDIVESFKETNDVPLHMRQSEIVGNDQIEPQSPNQPSYEGGQDHDDSLFTVSETSDVTPSIEDPERLEVDVDVATKYMARHEPVSADSSNEAPTEADPGTERPSLRMHTLTRSEVDLLLELNKRERQESVRVQQQQQQLIQEQAEKLESFQRALSELKSLVELTNPVDQRKDSVRLEQTQASSSGSAWTATRMLHDQHMREKALRPDIPIQDGGQDSDSGYDSLSSTPGLSPVHGTAEEQREGRIFFTDLSTVPDDSTGSIAPLHLAAQSQSENGSQETDRHGGKSPPSPSIASSQRKRFVGTVPTSSEQSFRHVDDEQSNPNIRFTPVANHSMRSLPLRREEKRHFSSASRPCTTQEPASGIRGAHNVKGTRPERKDHTGKPKSTSGADRRSFNKTAPARDGQEFTAKEFFLLPSQPSSKKIELDLTSKQPHQYSAVSDGKPDDKVGVNHPRQHSAPDASEPHRNKSSPEHRPSTRRVCADFQRLQARHDNVHDVLGDYEADDEEFDLHAHVGSKAQPAPRAWRRVNSRFGRPLNKWRLCRVA